MRIQIWVIASGVVALLSACSETAGNGDNTAQAAVEPNNAAFASTGTLKTVESGLGQDCDSGVTGCFIGAAVGPSRIRVVHQTGGSASAVGQEVEVLAGNATAGGDQQPVELGASNGQLVLVSGRYIMGNIDRATLLDRAGPYMLRVLAPRP